MSVHARTVRVVEVTTPDAFGSSAAETLHAIRAAVSAVLSSIGGMERAVDVATRLDLDRTLAWKIWQVGQGEGPLPSPAHIPGQQGFTLFLEAARRLCDDPAAIQRAHEAFEAFSAFTKRHAGDRAKVDSMLGGLTDQGRERLELALRRDGYRANTHFLGVSAACIYQLDVLIPPQSGQMPDVVRVRGHYGLQWIRPNVSWLLSRSTLVHEDGPTGMLSRQPVGNESDFPLLVDFCSSPTPTLHRRVVGGVTTEDELVNDRVGATSAIDAVTAERMTHMPGRPVESDAVTMSVMTPCERLVFDVLIPPMLDANKPDLRVFSTLQSTYPYIRGEHFHRIPVLEDFHDLGTLGAASSLRFTPAPEVPDHDRLVRWLAGRLGDQMQGSRVWRVRMKYPPVPSCLFAAYRLGGASKARERHE